MQNVFTNENLFEIDDHILKVYVSRQILGPELTVAMYGPQKVEINPLNANGEPASVLSDPSLRLRINQAKEALGVDLCRYIEKSFENGRQVGLNDATWIGLELLRLRPRVDNLAEMALDSGFYDLALFLGLKRSFHRAYACIHTGKDPSLDNLSGLELKGITVLKYQKEGKLNLARSIYEAEILPKIHLEPDFQLVGEIHNIAANTYFGLSVFNKAFQSFSQSYDQFTKAKRPLKAVSTAFNTAISALNVPNMVLWSFWFQITRNLSDNLHFDSLKLKIRTHNLQFLLKEEKFYEVLNATSRILSHDRLPNMVRVEVLQANAAAACELGLIIEARVSCAQSRQIILTHHLVQYELPQLTLENNIESLCYVRSAKMSVLQKREGKVNPSAYAEYRVSNLRVFLAEGKIATLKKSLADLHSTIPAIHLAPVYMRDLEIATHSNTSTSDNRIWAFQALLLRALSEKDISTIQKLIEQHTVSADLPHSPWRRALLALAQAYVNIVQFQTLSAAEYLRAVLDVTATNGLMRLYSVALGLLVTCDSHYEMAWLEYLHELDSNNRIILQNFIKSAIGRPLSGLNLAISNETLASPIDHKIDGADLVINQEAGEIMYKGHILPISSQSILYSLLISLVKAQHEGLTKPEIIRQVWGYSYDPENHDSLIYINIKRLRALVPVESQGGTYRIPSQLSWQFIVTPKQSSRVLRLTPRQSSIAKLLRVSSNNAISRSDVARSLKISPRTALRELTEMVDRKILLREGSGRSARYLALHNDLET